MRVREEDIENTTLGTFYGHYMFAVMPFGLTNTPQACMDLMHRVYRSMFDQLIVVLIDDLPAYSNTREQHEENL